MAQQYQLDVNWRTLAGYLERLATSGIAVNVVPIVGHGTIRSAVMGYAQRPPTTSELARMQTLLAEAMTRGLRPVNGSGVCSRLLCRYR